MHSIFFEEGGECDRWVPQVSCGTEPINLNKKKYIYTYLLSFMVNITDVDETLGAPALNIGGEPAMAEVQQAGIATVTKEPEALIPAETVAEHTADESEIPSKSRPTASSRKAGPTTKKVAPKKKPGI
jgi:hypothetical protein